MTRATRCPDCTLAYRRWRQDQARAEERDRLARIEQAAPPASTIDGALQRAREQGTLARKPDPVGVVVWDGTKGRQGHSLLGDGYGSSLGKV